MAARFMRAALSTTLVIAPGSCCGKTSCSRTSIIPNRTRRSWRLSRRRAASCWASWVAAPASLCCAAAARWRSRWRCSASTLSSPAVRCTESCCHRSSPSRVSTRRTCPRRRGEEICLSGPTAGSPTITESARTYGHSMTPGARTSSSRRSAWPSRTCPTRRRSPRSTLRAA